MMLRKKMRGILSAFIAVMIMCTAVPSVGTEGWKQLDNGDWKFVQKDGSYAADGVVFYKGDYYYVVDGKAYCGWLNSSAGKLYCNSHGQMLFGLNEINGVWYYFNDRTGVLVINDWVSYNGYDFYFGADGAFVESRVSEKNANTSTTSTAKTAEMVYITVNGDKYHKEVHGNMKDYKKVDIADAKKSYSPCSTCYDVQTADKANRPSTTANSTYNKAQESKPSVNTNNNNTSTSVTANNTSPKTDIWAVKKSFTPSEKSNPTFSEMTKVITDYCKSCIDLDTICKQEFGLSAKGNVKVDVRDDYTYYNGTLASQIKTQIENGQRTRYHVVIHYDNYITLHKYISEGTKNSVNVDKVKKLFASIDTVCNNVKAIYAEYGFTNIDVIVRLEGNKWQSSSKSFDDDWDWRYKYYHNPIYTSKNGVATERCTILEILEICDDEYSNSIIYRRIFNNDWSM